MSKVLIQEVVSPGCSHCARAKEILEKLYDEISKDYSMIPKRYQEMLNDEREEIVVADYIAGMTDRFAISMYEQFP